MRCSGSSFCRESTIAIARYITGVVVIVNISSVYKGIIFSYELTYVVVIVTYFFTVTIPYLGYIASAIVSIGIGRGDTVYGRRIGCYSARGVRARIYVSI